MKERLELFARAFDRYEYKDGFNIVMERGMSKFRFEILSDYVVRLIASDRDAALSVARDFLGRQTSLTVVYSFDFPPHEKKWITNSTIVDELLSGWVGGRELTYNFHKGAFTVYLEHEALKNRYVDFRVGWKAGPVITLIDRHAGEAVREFRTAKDIEEVDLYLTSLKTRYDDILVQVRKAARTFDGGAELEGGSYLHFLGKHVRLQVRKMEFDRHPYWHIEWGSDTFLCERDEEVLERIEKRIRKMYEKEKLRYLIG
jgi:hypothetical protein